MRQFRLIFTVILAMLPFLGECTACTVFPPTISAGPDFKIRVVDRGRPVEGLRFVLGGVRAVTNRDGIAAFRNMAPGAYSVHAPLDAGISGSFTVDVKSDGPRDVILPLAWPTWPVVVRSVAGRVYLPDYLFHAVLSLDLLDGLTGDTIGSTTSNDRLEFAFPKTRSGFYFLRLNPNGPKDWHRYPVEGLISVVVDPAATAERLALDLGWSSCGLAYTDRNKCSSNDLQLEQLCGRVSDTEGAAIGNASVSLFSTIGDNLAVEGFQADRSGHFALSKPLDGTYDLVIGYAGFTPFRARVHLKPSSPTGCRQPLRVKLSIVSSCSTAVVESERER